MQHKNSTVVGALARGLMAAAMFVVLLTSMGPLAHAQYAASLRGTVTDATGAVIPGAVVTLTDIGTNEQHTAVANGAGIYTINALPPDTFSLKATHAGFKAKAIENVVLIPEQTNALNLTLELGKEAETVTVYGSVAPLLDRDTATLSATIDSNQIQHLPSFNRDVTQLLQLAPGAFGDGSQTTFGNYNFNGNQGPGGGSGIFATENGPQVQVRGGQYETNGISIDGISTVSAVWGGTTVITPTEDSVESVKITTNSYDAETGRFDAGKVEITSKSGTNDPHGSAFFKASRPGLNAYQRWNGFVPGENGTSTPGEKGVNENNDRTNNFGASLGGPIWKNKIFGFFAFEASPTAGTGTSQGWFDTPQFDSTASQPGSIANKYLTFPGEAVANGTLVQQTCAQIGLVEGVNCNTEAAGLDVGSPLTTGLGTQDLTYLGTNQNPGVGNGLDGSPDIALYTVNAPSTKSQVQYNVRIDADATSKDHLSFSTYWMPISSSFLNGPARQANFWHHKQITNAGAIVWNHVFSPTLVNQARANVAGWRWNELSDNPQVPFGLPVDSFDQTGNASPNSFGPPGPSNLDQWTYDYNDVLTKTLGRQNLKAGGDFTRLYYLNNPLYNVAPNFSFHNMWDFANDAPYFEAGNFNYQTGVPTASRQDDRMNIFGLFIQDDYKVRPNLTINAGLRWSYFAPYHSKENNLDVVQYGTGVNVLTDLNVRIGGNLQTAQKTNFGPQLGFAWSPKMANNKLVVRGGYGINFNQNEIAILANGFGNLPNSFNANFRCGYPYTTNPTCANTGIQYETATSINSLFGYAPNPAATTTLGPNNLPSTLSGTIGLVSFPAQAKTIQSYHYSLDLQYELPYDTVATIGYLGSQDRHSLDHSNYNITAAQNNIPLNPSVSNLDYWNNDGTGNYNGLITTLKHNFSHQFNAEAQYTWSKAMDDNSGPYSEDIYSYDAHAAYGRSDYNVSNAFKLFGLWQPVFFHGANGWLEKVAGEWSLSGIWNVHGGFPWNPVWNTQGEYYQGGAYQLRPTQYLGGAGGDKSNKTYEGTAGPGGVVYNTDYGTNGGAQYYGAPTYILGPQFPNTAPGPTPGIRRNSLTTPGYNDIDMSLTKGFGLPKLPILGNNAKLEFRADSYNLFNKTNLNPQSVDGNLGSLNPNGTYNANPHFGVAGGALGSRTVQLQARFSF